MALPEARSSFGIRLGRAFDGLPGLASYLVFTTLDRRAPAAARWADALSRWRRGRTWLVGNAATEAGNVRIAYLGSPDAVARWLLARLGATSVREHAAPHVPGAVPCDVELGLVPASDADAWARSGWLVLPRWVNHRQRLENPPNAFELGVARRAQAARFSLRLTHDVGELERFQRTLYDPMLTRRHGEHALRTGRALLRLGQRRGGLLVVRDGGRAVAGAVAAPSAHDPKELEIWALGVAADAPRGAGLAAVLGWVSYARERHQTAVDHVASLPLYSDGLTRQKRRWGTELGEPPRATEVVALRVQGDGAAVRSFLARHSFAARGKTGLVRVDVSEPAELARAARTLAEG